MKTIKYLYILLAVMLCGTMPVMAQNTNDNHNKAVFQSTDGDSEVNTDDIQIIRFDGGKVTLVQPWGETVFDRTLRNLTFFRPLPGTLRLIVDANIGGEGTDGGNNRAYEINGDGDLISVWRSGDEVYVYADESSTASIGTLTPETYGARSARLTGNINANLNGGETLYLETKPRTFSFATQTGTLSDLFYAKATATVSIVGGNATISDASFTRPMAVVKFTLKDKDVNGNPTFNADALRVTDGTTTVVINDIPAATYTNNGDGVLYVAMPGFTGRDVTVEAYSAGKLYAYTKSNVSFADSKYYDISIKMSPATNINLANVFRDITVTDGCTVTGTLANILKISIADGATVTLDGASINADRAWTNSNNAGITCVGDATIILADGSTNHVNGFNNKYPGIYVPGDPANSSNNKTLTIKGNGTLNASTILGVNDSGAGIGGSGNSHCGNIRIEGGTINATGGKGATGIGGGWNTSCGDITITGGTITAVGGIYAAGIGSGAGTGGTSGRCGDIVITGGTIDATGGDASAGIGGGKVCGDITITGTNITARKGSGAPYSIGAGNNASCGTVTVNYVEGSISTSPYTTSFIDLSAAGNANTYIVSSAGIYKFDATVKGNGGLDPLTGTTATKIDKSSIAGVKVLWEVYDKGRAIKHDGTKYAISYNDGYVYFSTPDVFAEGDCYVAVYDAEDKILWSWLIWATATPSEQTVGSDKFMNCNLGSIQVAYCTRGFLYEWGRKDPFPSTKYNNSDPYDYYPARMTCHSLVNSSQSVSYTIENPTTYIYNTAWVTDADYKTNLWSDTEKTIYDPCPAGWRTPTSTQMSSFHSSVGLGALPSTGFIGNCSGGDFGYGNPSTGYYWSSTGVDRSNAKASCNDGRLNNNWPVNEGYAIRPVKE